MPNGSEAWKEGFIVSISALSISTYDVGAQFGERRRRGNVGENSSIRPAKTEKAGWLVSVSMFLQFSAYRPTVRRPLLPCTPGLDSRQSLVSTVDVERFPTALPIKALTRDHIKLACPIFAYGAKALFAAIESLRDCCDLRGLFRASVGCVG